MIESRFIIDILSLLLDSSEHQENLMNQVPFLRDFDYEYTGAGLFVSFDYLEGVNQYKILGETIIINGVKIESQELTLGAEAAVFVINGLINFLEIWSYDANYPNKELESYTITQVWNGSPGRQLVSSK